MALPIPIQLQSATTITSAAAGTSNDISGVTTDFTIELTIVAMSAASGVPAATFVFEDSVDAFTNKIQRVALDIQGTVVTPDVYTWRAHDHVPNIRAGIGSAVLRSNVLYLAAVGGSTPSLTYAARMF